MCATCSATEAVLLSELEHEVMLAEAGAGLGDTAAHRPLSDVEKQAKVRFGEIAGLEDEYLGTVAPILEDLRAVVDGEIIAALAGAVTATALVDALEALIASQPPAVAVAVREAAEAVQGALSGVYAGSSAVAIGEARRQGVEALPEPLEARPGVYAAAARRVALEPWQRALEITRKEVTKPQVLTGQVLDQDLVPAALANYDQAGALDAARQFAHAAIGGGRDDAFQALPEASYYYASELLDGKQCDECARVDGKEYQTFQETRQDYRTTMIRCRGGARCRGLIVAVWE